MTTFREFIEVDLLENMEDIVAKLSQMRIPLAQLAKMPIAGLRSIATRLGMETDMISIARLRAIANRGGEDYNQAYPTPEFPDNDAEKREKGDSASAHKWAPRVDPRPTLAP